MKASDFKYEDHRNSYTELNEVYFWTMPLWSKRFLEMKSCYWRKGVGREASVGYPCARHQNKLADLIQPLQLSHQPGKNAFYGRGIFSTPGKVLSFFKLHFFWH